MKQKSILVIGESCRDIFVYCECNRLCPDIPVPALIIKDQTENYGMAKNVHQNITSLVKDCDLMTNGDWYNITKTRYMHQRTNHMFLRVDAEHPIERINLAELSLDYKIVVISDYNKGFLTEDDIANITSRHPCVFIDTKKILGGWAEEAKYIKINDYEYNRTESVLTKKLKDKIIHTIGEGGCIFNDKQYPVKKIEVCDTSGAGDTFMSGLVCNYLKTQDINKAIVFANKCASDVVQHRGVTTL